MKQLYFVRHGESELNRSNRWSGQTDTPLTPRGHEQAKAAGKKAALMGVQFDRIISSPLERAFTTAQHIAAAIDYPPAQIITNDLFKERSFGKLESTPHRLVTDLIYALNESSVDRYGSEPYINLQKRGTEALEFLMTQADDTILVVAHSSFGRALFRAAQPKKRRYTQFKNAQIVRFL